MYKGINKAISLMPLLLLPSIALAQAENDGFETPHHLSVLFADTHIDGEGNNPSIGIDYEFRVSELTGLGVVLEYAAGEIDATTVLTVADIHLHEGWVMQIGPGYEYGESENSFVSRIGFLYEFELEGFTFSPQLHWDYHSGGENAVVAGFALGFSY